MQSEHCISHPCFCMHNQAFRLFFILLKASTLLLIIAHLFQQRVSCRPIGASGLRHTCSLFFSVTLKNTCKSTHSVTVIWKCVNLQDLVLTSLWLCYSWGFLGWPWDCSVVLWHPVAFQDTDIFLGQMCCLTPSLHTHSNEVTVLTRLNAILAHNTSLTLPYPAL